MTRSTRFKPGPASSPTRGFTLVELLVVLLIILIVSAAALPTILTGLRQRQVGEAARTFQAALGGARDAAIANNAPRGIRLLSDPVLTVPAVGTYSTVNSVSTYVGGNTTWACNRFVPIEPASDYREGRISFYPSTLGWYNDSTYSTYAATTSYGPNVLFVYQSFTDSSSNPVELTSWAWNLRVGDKIQFEAAGNVDQLTGSGHIYTVVGPVVTPNPEQFINYGDAGPLMPGSVTPPAPPEFLFLVNGVDDDSDGFIDYGFDGVDNNNNGLIDDSTELTVELEQWLGAQVQEASSSSILRYVAKRRPVPARGARETLFPANVVIDLTTWNRTDGVNPERSRLPITGISRYIDVLIDPSGQIIQSTAFSSPSSYNSPFLHFWLTDREGVAAPLWGMTTDANGNPISPVLNPQATAASPAVPVSYMLPMPAGTPSYTTTGSILQGERMLITLYARTGNMTITSLQNFNATDVNTPFYAAQRGVKESP